MTAHSRQDTGTAIGYAAVMRRSLLVVLVLLGAVSAGWAAPTTRPGKEPKYDKPTEAQIAAAMERARARAKDVEQKLDVKLVEMETDHFLIFTNWDKREHGFLKKCVEQAYSAVSKNFDIPSKENIFVGKLPVFMFDNPKEFRQFGTEVDGFKDMPSGAAGYYRSRGDGSGHMVMPKPLYTDRTKKQAEEMWAYVLTHEFTHAFVERYKGNGHIPTWLNEGLAEMVAAGLFPRDVKPIARQLASRVPLERIITDKHGFQGIEVYPIGRTIVETLVLADRKKFLKMFEAIKDGEESVDALKAAYGWSVDDLEKAWKQYLGR